MNFHVCKIREINDIKTPLLVPSFSSKGFRDIGNIHCYLKDSLSETSLISAYDLHYKFIHYDNIYETDIVFIDSGGYERNKEHDLSEIYGIEYIPKLWNYEMYKKTIKKIEPISDIVLINYDFEEPLPLFKQVEMANNHFHHYPFLISDFLYKPINTGSLIDVEELIDNIHMISNFDILGLTEKELGYSVLERCTSIYRIRLALEKANINIPIHIFGCLDPLNILVYFLSGADIFDGLSWLRFSYDENMPTYINSHNITSGKWNLDDMMGKMLTYSDNVQELSNLKRKMIQFVECNDLSIFGLKEETLKQVSDLIMTVYKT